MRKKSSKNALYGIVGIVVFAVVVFGVFGFGGVNFGTPFLDGNIAQLSFTQTSTRDISCEAFNEIAVTKNGVKSTLASGREGIDPFVDASLLSLQQGSAQVDAVHPRLVLVCDGDYLDDGDLGNGEKGGSVSGKVELLFCGTAGGSGTRCLETGTERHFTISSNVATSTQQFTEVPFNSRIIQADQRVVLWEGSFGASQIESAFPEGSGAITFVSRMYPTLTFQFDVITGQVFDFDTDMIVITTERKTAFVDTTPDTGTNDLVYAQYNGLANVSPPPPDSDGDGFTDNVDACTGQPEDLNGYQDNDGCPDQDELDLMNTDSDGDGFNDFVDACPNEFGLDTGNDGCPIEEDTTTDTETTTETVTQDEDADGDGVPNSIDACQTTPPNVQVDANGCEIPETQQVTTTPPSNGMDDIVDNFQDFFADPVDPLFTPPVQTQTGHTAPQTTTSGIPVTAQASFIEGVADTTLFLILVLVGVVIAIAIVTASGKAKL